MTCTKKNRYPTERKALAALFVASRRSGLALRAYHCPECKGWHLTKQESKP